MFWNNLGNRVPCSVSVSCVACRCNRSSGHEMCLRRWAVIGSAAAHAPAAAPALRCQLSLFFIHICCLFFISHVHLHFFIFLIFKFDDFHSNNFLSFFRCPCQPSCCGLTGINGVRNLLCRWVDGVGNLMRSVVNPGRATLPELQGSLERWDGQVRNYFNSKDSQNPT